MNAPLDPLSDFRSDGYGLDDARRARMRSRVLDAIPDDGEPAVGGPVATAVREVPRHRPDIDLTGAQALEAMPADGHPTPGSPAVRPGWPNRRRLLVAAAVAVVIGLMAVVAGASRSTDRQVGTLDSATTKTSLDELAATAGAQPDHELAPGEYQQIEITQGLRLDDGSFELTIDENWHTIDGSGHHRTSTAKRPSGAQPGDETDVTTGPLVDDYAGLPAFGPFGYEQLLSAPTDPSDLLEAIRAASPRASDWAIAEQIANLEALTTTPHGVRGAGFKILSYLGFRPVGLVSDPRGRTGVGFQAETPDGTEVLAFDPDTGRALGYWNSPVGGPATPQAATRWTAFANAMVTDHSS